VHERTALGPSARLLAYDPAEDPVALQLGGCEPRKLAAWIIGTDIATGVLAGMLQPFLPAGARASAPSKPRKGIASHERDRIIREALKGEFTGTVYGDPRQATNLAAG
jgi:hypothetical protein